MGEATTFPFIVFSVPLHEAHIQMAFCLRTPKWEPRIPTIATPATLGAHNFVCKPLIVMNSTAKLYPLSRSFQHYVARHLHATKSGQFPTFSGRESNWQFDSQPLFAHNLCLICPNGSCEPISNIYISIAFHWYKELFKPMGFDSCNRPLKIRESIGTPTPKMGVHLGVWRFIPSHSCTPRSMWCDSRASLLARNLTSPCFARKLKARVTTIIIEIFTFNNSCKK